jgi:hypothetical protein
MGCISGLIVPKMKTVRWRIDLEDVKATFSFGLTPRRETAQ